MSYSEMRPDGVAYYPAVQAGVGERIQFLQKVYLLTFAGVAFFAANLALPIIGAAAGIGLFEAWVNLSFSVHPLLAFGLIVGSSFLVHSISMVRGLNMVAFFAFSGIWAFLTLPLIAFALFKFGAADGTIIIAQAATLTTIVFGGLTSYVLLTRRDFSFMGAALSIGFWILMGGIIIGLGCYMMGIEVNMLHFALSIFAVILFSGYVLYDTSEILHRYATDMVVPAALALMVDFIIIFRNILYLFIASRD